ncbi:MAG: Acetylxylan esterase precursor [Verrucomicrobiota bacterium]|jgi:acetyl esterase/lipase|nr:alpha/beta hydrolase [Opitutaceae bacterium]
MRRPGFSTATLFALIALPAVAIAATPTLTLDVWPGTPPGETKLLPPEADQTKETDRLIAGRRIIKLGNVSRPQLAVFRPAPEKDTGAAVIICPGGGFNILAYDLEGTEVAEWLNGLGVTGIVLKYRVPARDPAQRWLAAVQDAQRAMGMVRRRAAAWGLDERRIGILGFSAGGVTAGYAALSGEKRHYTPQDEDDRVSCRADFALLIYTAGFVERGQSAFRPAVEIGAGTPPFFLVHAFDDGVPVQNSLLLAAELRRNGGSAEVHVYDTGGHGYGLRPVPDLPVTTWPARAAEWFVRRGLLRPAKAAAP